MNKTILLILLLAAGSGQLAAQTVYKSVDAEGNITFSDAPGPGGESTPVAIDAPPPSAESVAESQERAEKMVEAASIESAAEADSGAEKAAQIKEAEESLKAARAQLEEAKVVGPGDRKGTASGGSRLTPEYQERVQEAERQVQDAQSHLKDVKSSR